MRNQYKLLAEKYQLITEARFSIQDYERLPNDFFPESREDFLKLVSIEKPTDITQFAVGDAWVDDHQTCLGVSINEIQLGLWWIVDDDEDDEPVIPKNLSVDFGGSRSLSAPGNRRTDNPSLKRLQGVFEYFQNWFNFYEPDEINDPALKGLSIVEIREFIKKRYDALYKDNPGIEMDI